MSGRTLRNYVHVTDPDTGAGVWLAPHTEVPAWAHEAITNPRAWNQDPGDAKSEAKPEAKPAKAPTTYVDATPPVDATKPPPRGGAGSGRAEWAAYATANGVELTDDLKTRDDIIAALELAGIPTEAPA